jgi:hypothetical protein
MLDVVKNKFSILRKKDSLVHKLDTIKNGDQQSSPSHSAPVEQPMNSEFAIDKNKMEQMQEDTVKKNR